MKKQEIIDKIIYQNKIVIPYIKGTINLTMRIDDNWIKVHSGRAYSLLNQLKNIEKLIGLLDEGKENRHE